MIEVVGLYYKCFRSERGICIGRLLIFVYSLSYSGSDLEHNEHNCVTVHQLKCNYARYKKKYH